MKGGDGSCGWPWSGSPLPPPEGEDQMSFYVHPGGVGQVMSTFMTSEK